MAINLPLGPSTPSRWNAAPVSDVGAGLSINSGTISSSGGAGGWNAGSVDALGNGLSLDSGTLAADPEWNAGLVTAIGQGITLVIPPGTPPAIDSHGTGGAVAHLSAVHAVLSTNHADEVICALVSAEFTAVPTITSMTSTSGLTWSKEAIATETTSTNQVDLELWWAPSPLALSSETITAHFSGTFDAAVMLAFGVTGADLSNPFDTASNLPQQVVGLENPGDLHYPNITTNNPGDLLIFGAACANSGQLPSTIPSGSTIIATFESDGNNAGAIVSGAFDAVSVTQSGTNSWPLGVFGAGLYTAIVSGSAPTAGTIEVSGPLGTVVAIGAGLTITAGTLHT